jgi:hypothetical protein
MSPTDRIHHFDLDVRVEYATEEQGLSVRTTGPAITTISRTATASSLTSSRAVGGARR